MDDDLTPEVMLRGYAAGIFPMARSRDDDTLLWYDPTRRGILPVGGFHISRSLARTLRRARFAVTLNAAFADVIDGCADREDTWINPQIRSLSLALHARGHAHSIEVWDGATLAGGVYGLTLGGAFFAESMFSARRDASKVALAYLMDRVAQTGFMLVDTQFITPHLERLGGVEIDRATYRDMLGRAMRRRADLTLGAFPEPQVLLQRMTHTS